MDQQPVAHIRVTKINTAGASEEDDQLAVEQPLGIHLEYAAGGARMQQPVSVTMRTPGQDTDLSAGFLFTEGILRHAGEVLDIITPNDDANLVMVFYGLQDNLSKKQKLFEHTGGIRAAALFSLQGKF